MRQRGSVSTTLNQLQHTETANSGTSQGNEVAAEDEVDEIAHPVEPRAKIPMLPPVLNKVIDTHPACGLEFTEEAIITSCKNGHIRTWSRPGAQEGPAASG
jgi:hypothetical protein